MYSVKDSKITYIVITQDLDEEFFLTYNSLLSQILPPFQLIVVCKRFYKSFPLVVNSYNFTEFKFISGEDNSIPNAFNIGLSYALGDFISFLNAGDKLINDSIVSDVTSHLQDNKWVIFKRIDAKKGLYSDQKKFSPNFSFFDFCCGRFYISHQAVYYSRKIVEKVGLYNEKLKLHCMDYEYNLRTWKIAVPVIVDFPVVLYDMNGISSKSFLSTNITKLIIILKTPNLNLNKYYIALNLIFQIYKSLIVSVYK